MKKTAAPIIESPQDEFARLRAELKKLDSRLRARNLDLIFLLSSLLVKRDGGVTDAELLDHGLAPADRVDLRAVQPALSRLLSKLQAADSAAVALSRISRRAKRGEA